MSFDWAAEKVTADNTQEAGVCGMVAIKMANVI